MTTRTRWLNRLVLLIVWVAITAGVSFLVARAASDEDVADVTAPVPPITAADRANASLSEQTIVPIVSASGSVVPDGEGYRLEAPALSDDLAYRLLDPPMGVRALINGGPVGFDCTWIGIGPAGDFQVATGAGGLARETTNVTMRCRIPADVRVVAGMSGTMVLQMGTPTTAQALPISAVVGDAAQGQLVVVVRDDGTTTVRTVQLGVSDTYNIQITGGLDPAERVLLGPTQSDLVDGGVAS